MNDYVTPKERVSGLKPNTQSVTLKKLMGRYDNPSYDRQVIPYLLTQDEVATILRKAPRWLERKRWEGGGPPFRYIGRTPVYEMGALLEWLEDQPTLQHTSELLLEKLS